MISRNTSCISRDSKEHGVSKTHHTGKTKKQVLAQGEDGKNEDFNSDAF